MGFYTQYFSTLLKNVSATSFKQRWESRRIVNGLKDADHRLYTSLFDEVENKHQVTKAIKEEERLLKSLRIAAENADKLMFNAETEEITLLKTVEEILKSLEEFSKSVRGNGDIKKLELELLSGVLIALQKAEMENQKEFKQIRTIIALSENRNVGRFTEELRLRFQRKDVQTVLAKFALRKEARKAKIDLQALKVTSIKIRLLIVQLKDKPIRNELKRTKEIEEQKGSIYYLAQDIKKYLNDAFYELFLIMRRDTLFMLKILYDFDNLFGFNLKWAGKNYMPRNAVTVKNQEIADIRQKIAKDFHTFAQAFNIILKKIEELERIVQADLATVKRS
ncbi:hypothetical protein HYV80_03725 [Candidatus Woesearchaeota archaeon]|nr:hypothetical protein [Candidatus Woesearchaeota archaeon]